MQRFVKELKRRATRESASLKKQLSGEDPSVDLVERMQLLDDFCKEKFNITEYYTTRNEQGLDDEDVEDETVEEDEEEDEAIEERMDIDEKKKKKSDPFISSLRTSFVSPVVEKHLEEALTFCRLWCAEINILHKGKWLWARQFIDVNNGEVEMKKVVLDFAKFDIMLPVNNWQQYAQLLVSTVC